MAEHSTNFALEAYQNLATDRNHWLASLKSMADGSLSEENRDVAIHRAVSSGLTEVDRCWKTARHLENLAGKEAEQILKVFRIYDHPLNVVGLFHSREAEVAAAVKPVIVTTQQASSYFSPQKANTAYLSPVRPFPSAVSPISPSSYYLPWPLSVDSIRQGIELCLLVFCQACLLRLSLGFRRRGFHFPLFRVLFVVAEKVEVLGWYSWHSIDCNPFWAAY